MLKGKKKPNETNLQSIEEYNFIINLSSVRYNHITWNVSFTETQDNFYKMEQTFLCSSLASNEQIQFAHKGFKSAAPGK